MHPDFGLLACLLASCSLWLMASSGCSGCSFSRLRLYRSGGKCDQCGKRDLSVYFVLPADPTSSSHLRCSCASTMLSPLGDTWIAESMAISWMIFAKARLWPSCRNDCRWPSLWMIPPHHVHGCRAGKALAEPSPSDTNSRARLVLC